MIKVITKGEVIGFHKANVEGVINAQRQARRISLQTFDIPVYVQDGNSRSIFRNGYLLFV